MQEWLTAQDAAEYAQCSTATIRAMANAGKLKVARLTTAKGGMRFRKEWIDHWLEKSTRGPRKVAVNQ